MLKVVVESSSIAAIGYAASSRTLEIEFRNGGLYRYQGVPAEDHRALMAAESKGQFVNRFIKPRYDVERVQGTRR